MAQTDTLSRLGTALGSLHVKNVFGFSRLNKIVKAIKVLLKPV